MRDIEKAIIVCTGRAGMLDRTGIGYGVGDGELWQHVWYDVSAWRSDWTRNEFERGMKALVDAGYIVRDKWMAALIALTGKGRETYETLEGDMSVTGKPCIAI